MNDGSPRRPPRLRGWLAAAATLLLLAGVAGFRTLRPAEVHQVARQPYPQGPGPSSRMPGRMPNLPLIVDGVLGVFAEPYQVRADAPLSRRYPTSPFWSLRRWPQQLLGVAAVGRLVLTRWSDGVLLALDAPTGAVAWRLAGPPPAAGAGHDDRATGARTVRAPEGMHTAGDVVAVAGGREFVAVDGRGAVRWRRPLPECLRSTFGTADARLVHVAGCAAPRLLFVDARTGADAGAWAPGGAGADAAVEPLGCGPAVSDCHGMRVRAGGRAAGYLLAGARPVAAPALADPAALLVPRPGAAPLAVRVADGAVVAAHARDGAPAWRWRPARALITPHPPKPGGKRRPPHRVTTAVPEVGHLLAWHAGSLFVSARDGVSGAELDLATGRQRSGFPMEAPDPPVAWRPGEAVAGAGFVAVEQLRPGARPGDDDRAYFVAGEPVIVAGPLFDDPAGGLR